MGDPDEPTVKERPASGAPTVDGAPRAAKITESSTAASAFDPPGDRFEARGELGRGGMGRVDEAFDRALGRDVAIKHMLSHSDVDLARFEREARITARLEHPGIVPIHDAGRGADGTPYYVMRRVDGRPLSDLVGGKPLEERLRLVPNILAACDAAAFAHARGIVHRDIKPTNILVGPFGETLLIDWGLAREMESRELTTPAQPPSDPSLTRAGTVAGTPGFMSPEQARGESVDARADVFALGATLFYVLAGNLPWHGGSTEMIDHVGAGRPADWRLMSREVPADLRAIVEKAMATNLVDRYPDAGALAADLRRFTLGNLVAAYEYGPIARLVRFMRRHRAAVLVGTISLAVLGIVAAISVRRVIAERDGANAARRLAESRQQEAMAAADRLLVAHAHELAFSDPIAAIAVLRTLRSDSPSWPEAWAAATAAWFQGIPFGFVGFSGASVVQISHDGRHAALISMMDGRIAIIDLASRTRRDLGEYGRVYGFGWFDGTHILVTESADAYVIDIATGAKRALGLVQASLWTNRNGLAVLKEAHRLFELSRSDGELVTLGEDIDEYHPSRDLGAAVVHRGTRRELWSNGRTYSLPPLTPDELRFHPVYVVRPDLIGSLAADTIYIWDLRGDKLVERGHWPQSAGTLTIGQAGGEVYAIERDTVRTVGHPLAAATHGDFNSTFELPEGFALGSDDGSIKIRDSDGWLRLGKRNARYVRLDVSPDGRIIAAITTTGEVLFWDVSGVRPTAVKVNKGELPEVLTSRSLWMVTPVEGATRYDLSTGERAEVGESRDEVISFSAAPDDAFVIVRDRLSSSLSITPRGQPPIEIPGVEAAGISDEAVYYAKTDHSLWRWQDGQRTPIGTLPGPATTIVLRNESLIALLGDRELLRRDLRSGATERITAKRDIGLIMVDIRGRAWLLADGETYRWDPGASSLVAIPTPEPMDDLALMDQGVLLHGPRFLIFADGDKQRLIPRPSKAVVPMGDGLVGLTGPNGAVSVVDIASGEAVALPLSQGLMFPLVATRGRIGITNWYGADGAMEVSLFDIRVPRNPAELRQWLRDVTNAKPIPGSEVVAWPER